MVLPVICKTLIEGCILFTSNVCRFALPNRFVLVDFFIFMMNFLNLLGFLLFFLILPFLLYFTFFFGFFFIFRGFLFTFIVRYFLFFSLLDLELNWELDKFRVLSNDVLEFLFIKVLELVVLHFQYDACASGDVFRLFRSGRTDLELTSCLTDPHFRGLFVLLGDDCDLVCDKETGLKSDTELSD